MWFVLTVSPSSKCGALHEIDSHFDLEGYVVQVFHGVVSSCFNFSNVLKLFSNGSAYFKCMFVTVPGE